MKGEAVHFYGNAGVCVFKYLVTQADPQRAFSLTILVVNFACFLVISTCYILIHKQSTGSSSKNSAQRNTQARTLQAKIAFIIFTDFLAWVPFTIICFLHFGELIDAREWYPYFSVIILPFNSMINPILYNTVLFNFFFKPLMSVYEHLGDLYSWLMARLRSKRTATIAKPGNETSLSGFPTQDSRL